MDACHFTAAKVCTKCKEEKPITEFRNSAQIKSGTASSCKACWKAYDAARYAANPAKFKAAAAAWIEANPDKKKAAKAAWRKKNRLSQHGEELQEKSDARREKSRLQSAAYRKANPEKAKASELKWKAANRTVIKATQAAYRIANSEEIRAWSANYRKQGGEALKQYKVNWRRKNPGKVKAHAAAGKARDPARVKRWASEWAAANLDKARVYSHNRRATILKSGGKLSSGIVDRLMILQRGLCACGCGATLKNTGHHIDHIQPLSMGGLNVDSNCQLLTPFCNLSKGSKCPIEWAQSKGRLL